MRYRAHAGSGPGVRVNVALTVSIIGCVLALSLCLPAWIATWGATPAEVQMTLPGDDVAPRPAWQTTRAVTIEGSPAAIWPWLVQIGQDRAGFYSYDWLGNLAGADIHNSDSLVPAWQSRVSGDFVPAASADRAGERTSQQAGWRIGWLEPNRGLTLVGWGTFVIVPNDGTTTRLIVRTRTAGVPGPIERLIDRTIGRPLQFVMEQRMLLGIKARVEQRSTSATAREAATLGFMLAALAASWWLWRTADILWLLGTLALCVSLSVGTHDWGAAIVGCAATFSAVLGLIHVRRWWAVDGAIALLVPLVFLWAHDAYLTIGWTLLWLAPATACWALVFGVPRHRFAGDPTAMPAKGISR